MRLSALLSGWKWTRGGPDGNPEITGLSFDSRRTAPGDLFVAVRGHSTDGHDHVPEAIRKGAAALLVDRPVDSAVPSAVVSSVETLLSPMAARFYGRPSRSMTVVGVTGTSGKTTVTYMVEAILSAAGFPTGVLGTVEYRWAGKRESAPNTTPMAGDVQRLLAAMKSDGVTHAAMEVSSHALSLGRVADVDFSVGVFTNLTPEHLDFHKDMDGYFAAKARLFNLLDLSPLARGAAINADDPAGERMRAGMHGRAWMFGLENSADVSAQTVVMEAGGSSFSLVTPVGTVSARVPLPGSYNVSNALAAVSAALLLDVPLATVRDALAVLPGVPGRLERVSRPGAPVTVLVDYAHKEDALRKVLQVLRPVTKGKLIVLFGCGGDRDRGKRPLMGETAVRLADRVIITSDNPRSEDPAKIALDVEVGARRTKGAAYDVILDRGEAIERAIRSAAPGDVVLLAGKGHETYQIFKDRTVPFDDRDVARRVLGEP
jgi:UDP-N-acetylmuramoyl-L-alanyl-D-glutamate--2,6-diaminopimelate ligase